MFKCQLAVVIPTLWKHGSPWCAGVAEYDFDPGWQPGDEIYVQDVQLTTRRRNGVSVLSNEPKFSFQTIIQRRDYVARSQEALIVLRAAIADKDRLPEMTQILRDFYARAEGPGFFDEPPPRA